MPRFYTYLIGAVCAYFFARLLFFTDLSSRTVKLDVIQGILVGSGLAFITAYVYGKIKSRKVNGWITMFGCGVPGNGMFLRSAHAWVFPGPITVPQEAMYWRTNVDGVGRKLDGQHNYIIHFPAGQLPPNDAFWSLTMGDAKSRFVENPIKRFNVGDHSGLVSNADGSVDIYIQRNVPVSHESNWLPAPAGNFVLWLRVYMPGTVILDGNYVVPPITKVK